MTPPPEQDALNALWQQSTLILIGHGSKKNPDSATPTRRIAEDLAAQKLFKDVKAVFWKEPPYMEQALEGLSGTIFLLPNFAGKGIFTDEIIPEKLALDGPVTQRKLASGQRQTLVYTPPVGAHPRIVELIAQRTRDIVAQNNLNPEETALLLIGHGSSRPGGSSITADAIVTTLKGKNLPAKSILPAFLEQEPLVAAWTSLTSAKNVVAFPLLVAQGLHGSEDLPPLFGLTRQAVAHMQKPHIGPVDHAGRRIWYFRGIGSDPEIIGVIKDILAESSAPLTT